jgi:hypothetical protein
LKINLIKQLLKCLIPVFLTVSFSVAVAGNTEEMDEAVKRYYAGYPDEAISMIKPLALAGDVDAQYLLGNILYSLSEKGKLSTVDDPVKWYKLAAEQNSADAVYALGVIFHNRWSESRDKKEAANAIIYYQNAVESGSKKAQKPLSKIISRSGISLQQAEAFVKEQSTTSTPEPESRVQISRSETDNFESDKTLAPISNSLAKNNTTIQKESDAEHKPTVENSSQTVQTADILDDELEFAVTLAEIARHCQNYTEAGFNLYADTIKGALLSGKASMQSIKLDPSKSGTYSVSLTHKQIDLVIFLDLRDVPKDVAVKLENGDKYAVTGIVVVSQAVGSNCTVSATYQSIKD